MPFKPQKSWLIETANAAVLLLLVVFLYARTAAYPFLNYDDGHIIFNHPVVKQGLHGDGVLWFLAHPLYGIWMPVTALTHMADTSLFGPWAGGHHLASAFWHAMTVLAFYAALRTLTGARGMSLFAAALFAVHPLAVEDVAWLSSRKDLISGLLFAVALIAHARHARRPGLLRYAALLAAVLLAFAGKTTAMPLPAVLLLLDAWPLGRFRTESPAAFLRSAQTPILEKIPMGLLALAVFAVTLHAQREAGSLPGGMPPLSARVASVGANGMHYLASWLWPLHLSPHYPRTALSPLSAAAGWGMIALLTAAALLLRRKCPPLTVGWCWFLLALVPVSGLIPYGNAPYADRHMYLPGMGLSLAAAGALTAAASRWKHHTAVRRLLPAFAALPVILLAALAWRQTAFWRNDEAVFTRVMQLHPEDDLAHAKLGDICYARGDLDGAKRHYEEALRLQPGVAEWHYNLGSMLTDTDPAAAAALCEAATRLNPQDGPAWTNLGYALLQLHRTAEAVPPLREGARLQPDNANAHLNLGVALLRLGDRKQARAAFQRALELDPQNAAAKANLAILTN